MNRRILTLALLICESIDLSREEFNSRKEDRVEFLGQVNVVVLLLVGDLDDLLLQAEQVLDIASLEIFSEQFGLVVVTSHVLATSRFVLQ